MEADSSRLQHRNAYNVTAMSVAPQDIAAEIRRALPDFTITYDVDPVRQAIADSWPRHMDDAVARTEWGWSPHFDLSNRTKVLQHFLCFTVLWQASWPATQCGKIYVQVLGRHDAGYARQAGGKVRYRIGEAAWHSINCNPC
jgi:hypothetical protein